MKIKSSRKKNNSSTKTIIIGFLVLAALVLPFFFSGCKTMLVPAGFSATSSLGQKTGDGQDSGGLDAASLGYQIIYIERAMDEKLNRENYVKLTEVAPELKDAIVAIEDNRFYRHRGIDAEGVLRAMLVNLQSGAVVEGGSTITQQLAKNLFLSQERSWKRKLAELILAVRIEYNYSKDDILEMYLNSIYFGSGAHGVKKAAAIYFNKAPSALNLAESALLAGLPNAPTFNSPYVNPAAAKKRQGLVLDAMARHGYIDPVRAQETKNSQLKFAR